MSGEQAQHELMTVAEVADGFRVVPMTIYRWIQSDDCPLVVVRVGHAYRITRESFIKLREGRS